MTIRILGIIITITKQERPEPVTINQQQREADVKAITSTTEFQKLREQAQKARAMRG